MTGLEIAATYATIVALVGQFKQEQKADSEISEEGFLLWLSQHHHEPIRKMILENRDLQTGIAKLLLKDNQMILAKIDELTTLLVSISSRVDCFQDVFVALAPNLAREDDTVVLLRQLVEKDWKKFAWMNRLGGNLELLIVEGRCEGLDVEEQFLEQDLDRLTELGFLRREYIKNGKTYALTRSAYRFANSLKSSESS